MAHFQFVHDINQKYFKEEVDLEDKLKAVREKYSSSEDKEGLKNSNKAENLSKRAARRNKALLKDLEIATGKLRVQSCYSPTEALLERNKQRYLQTLEQLVQSRACSSDRNSQILEQPEKLTWLDLSFNKLTSVAPELASFPSLKILYLHGNQLSDLTGSVRPLKCLDDLYSLTLHGNPLEERKGYRAKVLTALPQLKSLDFTNVTSAELKQIQIRKSASAAGENQHQNRVKSTF